MSARFHAFMQHAHDLHNAGRGDTVEDRMDRIAHRRHSSSRVWFCDAVKRSVEIGIADFLVFALFEGVDPNSDAGAQEIKLLRLWLQALLQPTDGISYGVAVRHFRSPSGCRKLRLLR